MHQILSYQTAMRAGNRDVREYITRRICISFVFSVGFFTLIAGELHIVYLLIRVTNNKSSIQDFF